MATYSKIEHSLYDNPKIVGLSCEAFRAYIEGILYSGKHLTDGFLDERIVARMWGLQVAEELSTNDPVNPSWERVDGGWIIYGFTERQNTKEHVESVKKKRKEAIEKRWSDTKAKQNSYKADTNGIQNEYKTDTKGIPDTDTDTDTDIKRATRIKETWNLNSDLKSWTETTAPRLNIAIERDKFVDYWLSKAGKDAAKTDWERTWKNWVRSNVQRNPELSSVVEPPKRKITGYAD